MIRASRVRCVVAFTAALLMSAGFADAQTPAAAPPDRGYVQAVAESAFGNVTSQSFGAEVGVTVRRDLQVFGSFGHVGDVSTPEISTAAATIASALTQVQTAAVSYSVKEPVTFFAGGVRYRFATTTKLKPYVTGGLGVGSIHKDVKFQLGGADAASTLPQYVTLGSDVSGDESGMMFTLGGGAVYPVWRQVILDLHYLYNRISTDTAIGVSRAGIGFGVSF